jgi:hypothetical protein
MARWWFPLKNKGIGPQLDRIERKLDQMPTRADMDAAKQALSQEIQVVVQHINDLEQKVQQGVPITQQDIDDLKTDLSTLQGTDQNPPPPTP